MAPKRRLYGDGLATRRVRRGLLVVVSACLAASFCKDTISFTLVPRQQALSSAPPPKYVCNALAVPVGASCTPEAPTPQGPHVNGHITGGACASSLVLLGMIVALVGCTPAAEASIPGKWSYGEKGADWGGEYPTCDGKAQTPINLKDADVAGTKAESLTKLLTYVPTDTVLFNNGGKTVQANGKFGEFQLPDGIYEVKQIHFHFPAEHELDGKLAAGELHIVHQKRGSGGTNDLAVVGIFLKQADSSDGPEGDFLKKLGFGASLPSIGGQKYTVPKVDLMAFQSEFGDGFYHYRGSLTTPPCSETVHWYVLKRGAPVTKGMIDSFKAPFPANNRATNPLNGRPLVASQVVLPEEY